MKYVYTYHYYNDPSLYNYSYYSIMCNGFCIGICDTEEEAKKIILERKRLYE